MAVKEKILVVDDEPSIRKYLQTLLEVDGFDVETVGSGREAIAQVNEGKRPDLIILDVLMPEMNGIEVLTELIRASLGLADSCAAALDRDRLLSVLDAQVRSEFGAGNIVRVDGWVLARTEGRLCALCE